MFAFFNIFFISMKILNWSKILHVFGHILRPQSGFYLMPLKYLILNNDRISLNILICLRYLGLFFKKKIKFKQ